MENDIENLSVVHGGTHKITSTGTGRSARGSASCNEEQTLTGEANSLCKGTSAGKPKVNQWRSAELHMEEHTWKYTGNVTCRREVVREYVTNALGT